MAVLGPLGIDLYPDDADEKIGRAGHSARDRRAPWRLIVSSHEQQSCHAGREMRGVWWGGTALSSEPRSIVLTMSGHTGASADGDTMRSFWDAKARENAMYYIHTQLSYSQTDEREFWLSGRENLDRTLEPFGLTISPGDQVVEIGCGIGRITKAIGERASSVVGIDVSEEMVKRGREALADFENIKILLGNGRNLDVVDDASADVVYSFIVFQHIPDPAITCEYVRDIGRVLRPGGWTVFQVSETPDLHRRERWIRTETIRMRLRRRVGRAPRGTLAPAWLGSAVPRQDLLDALEQGGLVLDGTVGDDTQFCLVHAHRPSSGEA